MRKVVGLHSAREALKTRSKKEITAVYFKPDWSKNLVLSELFQLAKNKFLDPQVMSLKKLNQIYTHHQGICVFVNDHLVFDPLKLKKQAVVLVLDALEDPKNFGAIIRTSWLMGVDGIFISSTRSVHLTPAVIKAASGGVEHIPIVFQDNLSSCVKRLKKYGFWVYALDARASDSLWDENFSDRTAFIFGREESGIRKSLFKVADKSLCIPQKFKEASYNVSVSAALVVGEYARQFQQP